MDTKGTNSSTFNIIYYVKQMKKGEKTKMIEIKNLDFDISSTMNEYTKNSPELEILTKMFDSKEQYNYNSLNELKFELQLRKEIVNAAIELNKSDMNFADFKNSRCNYKFWERTSNGGFHLKEGKKPSDGIQDIFLNGNKYATECATAIMIVYYKALLNTFEEYLFDKTFSQIYLMSWEVREPLLKQVAIPKPVSDVFFGDRQYFSNPDVNPEALEWKGENVIVLNRSQYYGHGIGIGDAEKIIKILNNNRKENATQSAYLNNSAGRPDFQKLANVYYSNNVLVWNPFPKPIFI